MDRTLKSTEGNGGAGREGNWEPSGNWVTGCFCGLSGGCSCSTKSLGGDCWSSFFFFFVIVLITGLDLLRSLDQVLGLEVSSIASRLDPVRGVGDTGRGGLTESCSELVLFCTGMGIGLLGGLVPVEEVGDDEVKADEGALLLLKVILSFGEVILLFFDLPSFCSRHSLSVFALLLETNSPVSSSSKTSGLELVALMFELVLFVSSSSSPANEIQAGVREETG